MEQLDNSEATRNARHFRGDPRAAGDITAGARIKMRRCPGQARCRFCDAY